MLQIALFHIQGSPHASRPIINHSVPVFTRYVIIAILRMGLL